MCPSRVPRTVALLVGLVASGCASTHTAAKGDVTPPPPQPAAQVPAGCERNLSGIYVHTSQPEFRYIATESSGALTLELQKDDARSSSPSSSSDVQIRLNRTAKGFVGETRAFGYSSRGTRCPVRFFTEVAACPASGLTLRTVPELSLDDECNTVDEGKLRETLVVQELKRTGEVPPAPTPSTPAPAAGATGTGGGG